MLIVIVRLGIIMSALTAAVVTTLNAAPDTENRLDDARSTRSLDALARDLAVARHHVDTTVSSRAGPGGMNITTSVTGDNNDCAGAGTNLLHLQWTETASISTTHVANYRVVVAAGQGVVRRYACSHVGAVQAVVEYRPYEANIDDRVRINSWRVCAQAVCN